MKNITAAFGTLYKPVKAILIYQKEDADKTMYIESYDMDGQGYPINAHPLSSKECADLAQSLDSSDELKRSFLKPEGLLPKNVLYINPDHKGYAVWHTPQRNCELLFTGTLGIPNGTANVPALIWKASKETLRMYAIADAKDIKEQTPLFHAPFFNVYEDGKVCMGSVPVNIAPDCLLETFMQQWEAYFFNSYFSHLFNGHSPVKGNIIQLWQSLIGEQKAFPVKSLIKNGLTLKSIVK